MTVLPEYARVPIWIGDWPDSGASGIALAR
jgi:hypothetical protein